ncbi:hypothetical protein [Novosphingobium mathurense]|uniref:DNA transfer protein p32 n=1 Tax=Novosphingobium mathurense TaxID=428990 RepID=A0A1U6I6V4_9SPHN|nr:hypothetical protein [Novosphingobium mathurense]SLK03722.1 hypothetical protein SAMN06295987_104287 [Novosphingobium mathurense]
MPPAVIGGAIAGVGAVGSAVIGSNAAKSAAKASQAGADASAAVQRDIYGQNKETLTPFVNSGVASNNLINSFLGISTPETSYQTGTPNYSAYVQANPDLLAEYQKVAGQFGNDMGAYGQYHWNSFGKGEGRDLPGTGTVTLGGSDPTSARNAFTNYLNNSDYAFQSALGKQDVTGVYAGNGTFQSGAALQALQDRQNNINQGYLGSYLNSLGNQQGVGLSAGSALAGVGSNYANSLGSIYTGNAANQANAKLVGAANTGQAINSLATIGANIFGSSR